MLAYSIGFTRSATNWLDVLDDLKLRGIEKTGLFVVDGFIELDKIIKVRFPNSSSTVHTLRNIKRRTKIRNKNSLVNDVKSLFNLTNLETIKIEQDRLLENENYI